MVYADRENLRNSNSGLGNRADSIRHGKNLSMSFMNLFIIKWAYGLIQSHSSRVGGYSLE